MIDAIPTAVRRLEPKFRPGVDALNDDVFTTEELDRAEHLQDTTMGGLVVVGAVNGTREVVAALVWSQNPDHLPMDVSLDSYVDVAPDNARYVLGIVVADRFDDGTVVEKLAKSAWNRFTRVDNVRTLIACVPETVATRMETVGYERVEETKSGSVVKYTE